MLQISIVISFSEVCETTDFIYMTYGVCVCVFLWNKVVNL